MNNEGYFFTNKNGRRVFVPYDDFERGRNAHYKLKNSKKANNDNNKKQLEIHDYNVDDVIKILEENYDKLDLGNLESKYVDGEDKNLCLKLQSLNNFNDKPLQLTEVEYKELNNNDYITMYRGFHDSISQKGSYYKEQFINGENSYGYGDVKYGIGHYAIDNYEDALYYGDSEKTNVLEMKIPKSARGIEYDKLREKFYTNFEKYNNNMEKYYNTYGEKITDLLDNMNYANTSSLAILDNYDYVYKNNVYVILNRGIVIVKKNQ